MSSQANGNGNGSQRPGYAGAGITVGTSNQNQTRADDEFDEHIIEEEETLLSGPPTKEKKKGHRNLLLIVASILVMLVVGGVLLAYLFTSGDVKNKTRVNVQDTSKANPSNAPTDQQLTAQAIDNLRNSGVSPTSGQTAQTVQPVGVATTEQGTAAPIVTTGVAGTVGAEPDTQTTANRTNENRELPSSSGSSSPAANRERSDSRSIESQPNQQRSFLFGVDDSRAQNRADADNRLAFPAAVVPGAPTDRRSVAALVRPPFGTMIPLRTLGAIYSLRPGSLVRMAATRTVSGDGWEIKNRTVFVGTLRGAQYDRAYISLIGFIDPASGRLVRIGGELYGSDGGTGMQGKRRRMDSRWLRVLGTAANTGLRLVESALGRNGTTIVLPSAQAAYGSELSTLQNQDRREFIEIQAGRPGYVMLTELPPDVKGVEALEQMDGVQLSNTLELNGETSTGLSEAELAELISTGSTAQIRAMLPRMTPQMRRIAESLLNQNDK